MRIREFWVLRDARDGLGDRRKQNDIDTIVRQITNRSYCITNWMARHLRCCTAT